MEFLNKPMHQLSREPVGMFMKDAHGIYRQIDPDIVKAYPNDPGRIPLYASPIDVQSEIKKQAKPVVTKGSREEQVIVTDETQEQVGPKLLAGWKDQLYAAMDAEFALREGHKRDEDGQRMGMVIDDTQVGVEFAMHWFEQNMIASVSPQQVGELPPLPEPLKIHWPTIHHQALGCGIEDRGIHDRYDAAEYGWCQGVNSSIDCVPEAIYTADQIKAYAHAAQLCNADKAVAFRLCRILQDYLVPEDEVNSVDFDAIYSLKTVDTLLTEINERLMASVSHGEAQQDSARLDLLIQYSDEHRFVLIDQKWHFLDFRGRVAGIGATKREAIDAALNKKGGAA